MAATHKRFNDHAALFLRRMQETFPEEPKIRVYRAKFDAVSTMDPKKPVEMFMENMIPFGEQILKRDEHFFKQSEYVGNAENISGKMGLVKYWDNMRSETQNSIWEFVQGLYILGMGSLGRQDELQAMIAQTGFSA